MKKKKSEKSIPVSVPSPTTRVTLYKVDKRSENARTLLVMFINTTNYGLMIQSPT